MSKTNNIICFSAAKRKDKASKGGTPKGRKLLKKVSKSQQFSKAVRNKDGDWNLFYA